MFVQTSESVMSSYICFERHILCSTAMRIVLVNNFIRVLSALNIYFDGFSGVLVCISRYRLGLLGVF